MNKPAPAATATSQQFKQYVGTLVGESTSREFRLAVAHEMLREQDIIAVDAELRKPEAAEANPEHIRVWAKVQRIERINPLFPAEAGHELAATRTNPFDTVLSLSREMVTAVCQVLGFEQITGAKGGKLDHLRYPAQPASSAYRPESSDIARIVLGDLVTKDKRKLDIARLSNRDNVDVAVDGHAIVTRHLAILAMTGAGKNWTARRVIEELAKKHYPIVIFDPHGDYTGLADVQALKNRVDRYCAKFPVFDEDSATVARLVTNLGYELSPAMLGFFPDIFNAAKSFWLPDDAPEMARRLDWLVQNTGNQQLLQYGIKPNMWLISNLAEAGEGAVRSGNQQVAQQLATWGWNNITSYNRRDAETLSGIKKRSRKAAATLQRMERNNEQIAGSSKPLPTDRKAIVQYGRISIVSLAGYPGDFQATIYSLIVEPLFEARVRNELKLPVLFVLEEAHNFVPGRATTASEQQSVTITRQIAQEGRKFNLGLVLISQRPSRLDETALSQCNSYIIMRLVNPADQNFVRKVIESLGEDEAKMLPDLDVGEAILSGQLTNFPVLVRIKEPESKGTHEEDDAFEHLEKVQDKLQGQGGR